MNFPVNIININDKDYPKLLRQLTDPPKQLYFRGNKKLLNSFCLGVVGTRKISAYGKETTEHIVSGLTDSRITIISGLAIGIDAVAHRSALDNDLPTIAVLGSGVDDDSIYPRSNYTLGQDILKNNGLIVSEYPIGFHANKATFPQRNRIISGLSKGVVVIEAAEKSGALITARSALDQNRDVFVVPGNIFSPNSQGPNFLLKNGAKPVFSAEDILDDYSENLKLNLTAKSNISTQNPIEKKILDILDKSGGRTADELIKESEADVPQLMTALSMLEISNKIKNKNGRYST